MKIYKTKNTLFSRELGFLERMAYLFDKYVETYHKEPTRIIMTKEEVFILFGRSKGLREQTWDIHRVPKSKRYLTYRGVKVIEI